MLWQVPKVFVLLVLASSSSARSSFAFSRCRRRQSLIPASAEGRKSGLVAGSVCFASK